MVDCIIGIGSNIQPEENIPLALSLLDKQVQVAAVSKVWQTKAVGTTGPDFLNVAVLIRTNLSETAIKNQILRKIEFQLGRERTADHYAPRPIDLDIVVYDGKIIDPELKTQAHVAIPVAELIPDFEDSDSGKSISEIAQSLGKKTNLIEKPNLSWKKG